jgi:hypothetical protein
MIKDFASGFDPSIFFSDSGIRGAVDEGVLNNVHKKSKNRVN